MTVAFEAMSVSSNRLVRRNGARWVDLDGHFVTVNGQRTLAHDSAGIVSQYVNPWKALLELRSQRSYIIQPCKVSKIVDSAKPSFLGLESGKT
jgi:hypothetical protein